MNGDIRFVVDFTALDARLAAIEDNQGEILAGQTDILKLLKASRTRETKMATDLTALTAEVQEVADVQQSAVTLIQGLAQAVRDAGTDPAALAALADQLDASTNALAAAVAAGQPPAPVEPPPAA